MLFPCEFVVKKVLPAIRAGIVRELFDKYNLKQNQIAKVLGITQSSVSLYLSGERGGFEEVYKVIDQNYIKDLAKNLMNDEISHDSAMNQICSSCLSIKEDGRLMDLLFKAYPELENTMSKQCWMSPSPSKNDS